MVIRGLQGTSEIVTLVVPICDAARVIALANWVWKTDDRIRFQPFFGSESQVTRSASVILSHDSRVAARGGRPRDRRCDCSCTGAAVGVAMRAVVDDRRLLELNGGRPDRVSLVSWAIGVPCSALAGILITPSRAVRSTPTLLTLLVINAFAAAMFGRLRNLPLTFVGAARARAR